jgi:RNA polymerase sigma factor (sigma-70 family)
MDLLERFACPNRSAECNDRVPFRIGCRQSGHEIGDTRPGGRDGNAGLSRHSVFYYLSATVTVLNRGLPGEYVDDPSAVRKLSYMTTEDPDLTLVQALKIGEDQALNALMDRHREGIFRFVLRQVHNEADALELAMETFVRAYFNIEKFRPAAKFATWLYQIALNLCRDHLRSRAYQDSLHTVSFDAPKEESGDPSLLPATEGRPDQKADYLEELVALQKAISELPEELKGAFILTALEGRQQADCSVSR